MCVEIRMTALSPKRILDTVLLRRSQADSDAIFGISLDHDDSCA